MTSAERYDTLYNYLKENRIVDPNDAHALDSVAVWCTAYPIFTIFEHDIETFEIIARGMRNCYYDGTDQ